MQASVNERELVLDMLLQITRDGEYSHIVIKFWINTNIWTNENVHLSQEW